MGYEFSAGGRDWDVREATVGQVLALRAFLARQPRPEPPRFNLEGMMDALSRGATEILPPEFVEKVDRAVVETHLREVRRMGRQVAEVFARELREEERSWPPDPTHPAGAQILLGSQEGVELLIHLMLQTSDPGILPAESRKLADPSNPDGILLGDFDHALEEFFGINRKYREHAAAVRDLAAEAEAQEASRAPKADAPAEGKGKARRGRAGRSTTTDSTPSS